MMRRVALWATIIFFAVVAGLFLLRDGDSPQQEVRVSIPAEWKCEEIEPLEEIGGFDANLPGQINCTFQTVPQGCELDGSWIRKNGQTLRYALASAGKLYLMSEKDKAATGTWYRLIGVSPKGKGHFLTGTQSR